MTTEVLALKDIISIGKDVIVAIATVLAASVAIYGLNSWRRETQGKARFEAARAFLLAGYRARDEIRRCRSPLIVAGEFPPDNDLSKSPEERYKAYAHVYSTRWSPVKDAMQSFQSATLDAEVVLGARTKIAAAALEACARKLFVAIEMYLSDMRSGHRELDEDTRRSLRQLIASSSKDDKLEAELSAALAQLAYAVKPEIPHAG